MHSEHDRHTECIQFGTFFLDSQLFGVNILQMREIIKPSDITRIPCGPEYMEGVLNLRGKVIPVISLRARLGIPVKPFDKETRIINVEIHNATVGFLVDSIGRVKKIPTDAVEALPVVAASMNTEFVSGLIRTDDGLLIAIDTEKLISDPAQTQE